MKIDGKKRIKIFFSFLIIVFLTNSNFVYSAENVNIIDDVLTYEIDSYSIMFPLLFPLRNEIYMSSTGPRFIGTDNLRFSWSMAMAIKNPPPPPCASRCRAWFNGGSGNPVGPFYGGGLCRNQIYMENLNKDVEVAVNRPAGGGQPEWDNAYLCRGDDDHWCIVTKSGALDHGWGQPSNPELYRFCGDSICQAVHGEDTQNCLFDEGCGGGGECAGDMSSCGIWPDCVDCVEEADCTDGFVCAHRYEDLSKIHEKGNERHDCINYECMISGVMHCNPLVEDYWECKEENKCLGPQDLPSGEYCGEGWLNEEIKCFNDPGDNQWKWGGPNGNDLGVIIVGEETDCADGWDNDCKDGTDCGDVKCPYFNMEIASGEQVGYAIGLAQAGGAHDVWDIDYDESDDTIWLLNKDHTYQDSVIVYHLSNGGSLIEYFDASGDFGEYPWNTAYGIAVDSNYIYLTYDYTYLDEDEKILKYSKTWTGTNNVIEEIDINWLPGLSTTRSIDYDAGGNRLWIAESSNRYVHCLYIGTWESCGSYQFTSEFNPVGIAVFDDDHLIIWDGDEELTNTGNLQLLTKEGIYTSTDPYLGDLFTRRNYRGIDFNSNDNLLIYKMNVNAYRYKVLADSPSAVCSDDFDNDCDTLFDTSDPDCLLGF